MPDLYFARYLPFDVEAIFLYPWAIAVKDLKAAGLGLFWFLEMLVYIAIVMVGLWYVWKKGILDWNSQTKAERL